MSAPSPVSLSLTCEWDRTRFELLDRRSAILHKLDQDGLLASFSVTVTPGLVLQLTNGQVVEVDLDSISLYEVADEDRKVSADAVIADIGHVLGAQTASVMVGLQHLVPWDSQRRDPAEAFLSAADAVMGHQRLGATDFALLYDSESPDSWVCQTEFGVVGAADVESRLLREAGRAVSYRPPQSAIRRAAASLTRLSSAGVLTFIDSSWTPPEPVDLSHGLGQAVTEATIRANAQAETLHAWVHPERTVESE